MKLKFLITAKVEASLEISHLFIAETLLGDVLLIEPVADLVQYLLVLIWSTLIHSLAPQPLGWIGHLLADRDLSVFEGLRDKIVQISAPILLGLEYLVHHLLGPLTLLQQLVVVLLFLTSKISFRNGALSLGVLLRGGGICGKLVPNLIEILALYYLGNIDSFGALDGQHLFDQSNSLGRGPWNDLKQIPSGMLLEIDSKDPGQSVSVRPGLVRGAQDLENFVELVELIVTFEEGLPSIELSHNTPQSEDVHWAVIGVAFEKNLRGPVPPGGNVVCIGRLGPDLPHQPKVGQLHLQFAAEQNVLWF